MLLTLLACLLLACFVFGCLLLGYLVAWLQVLVNNRMRQQQVYFNHVVTGCPALRTFDVHNVWERPLLFEIGADTAEIQVQNRVGERRHCTTTCLYRTVRGIGRQHLSGCYHSFRYEHRTVGR